MLWHFIKYYIGIIISVYFKRTKIKNAHYLKIKGPVIIAMNHPNGFMDPVAFSALIYPPRVRYLARGDTFKKGIITWILESFGIIPIFRLQDGGKDGLEKNNETYNIVNRLLKKNKKILVFAEGICIQERRLRQLKKGVPRMIFGAVETGKIKNLTVVPVGINYSNPSQFRSTIFVNVGKPFGIENYMPDYVEAPAKTMNQFIADLTIRMKELIVHINHKHSEAVIADIETIYKYDYFKRENLDWNNLEHDFMFSTKVVEVVNRLQDTEPEKLNMLFEKTTSYTNGLKNYNIKDWLINPDKQNNNNYFTLTWRFLLILFTLPVYVRGLIGNYIPYKLTYLITKKKVRITEFKASFYMGFGCVLFLLFYALQAYITYLIAPNPWWMLFVIVVSVVTGLICLFLSPFRKKTFGLYRLLKLKQNYPNDFAFISKQREEIIHILDNTFKG